MFSNLCTERQECEQVRLAPESRWTRSEEEDMQTAISYLYEFKKKLDKLHPNCINLIQSMLQDQRRY